MSGSRVIIRAAISPQGSPPNRRSCSALFASLRAAQNSQHVVLRVRKPSRLQRFFDGPQQQVGHVLERQIDFGFERD